jgi:hypothetical protein
MLSRGEDLFYQGDLEAAKAEFDKATVLADKKNRRVNKRNAASSLRQTGQRSKCSSIVTRIGRDTQSSTYNESDSLVSSQDIRKFRLTFLGWLTDPGCSLLEKEATPTSLRQTLRPDLSAALNGCCWPRSIRPPHATPEAFEPAVSSLRPIWHRV